MEALHGASSRIPFILQLFFKNSLEVMIRLTILWNKHGVKHMSCFEEFKYSSSCIPKCNSSYLIFWGGVMSFLTIWVCVSRFTCCQERDFFKSTNIFVGVILCHVSPKAFSKECCYYGAYQWSKFSPILLVKEGFHLLVDLNPINYFPLVAC